MSDIKNLKYSVHSKEATRFFYDKLISSLIMANCSRPENLMAFTLSRSNYGSSLFYKLLYLHQVIENLNQLTHPKEIQCSDPDLSKFLREFTQLNRIDVSINGPSLLSHRIKTTFSRLRMRIRSSIHLIFQRTLVKNSNLEGLDRAILIDSFLTPSCLSAETYQNRYYTNLDQFSDKSEIFWAFTIADFTKIKNYKLLYRKARMLHRKIRFVFLESICSNSSFIRTLAIVPLPKIPNLELFGIDLREIILADLKESQYDLSSFKAKFLYLGIKALKKKKVQLRNIINWDENQVIDHAWNLGFRDFFPNLVRKSYRGFIVETDQNFHLHPIRAQFEAGLLGDIYLLPGKHILEEFCKKHPYLKAIEGPAFRFMHIQKIIPTLKEKKILVCLPINKVEAEKIVIAMGYLEKILSDFSFVYRPHPTHTQDEKIRTLLKAKKVSKVSISEDLCCANMVISNTSSVCYEALALGLRVAIFQTFPPFNLNPIPESLMSPLTISTDNVSELASFAQKAFLQQNKSKEEFFYFDDTKALKNFFKESLR
jgi:hypothetical protein